MQTFSAMGQDAFFAQVAIDADGDALVVWERFDGTSDFCCDRVQARARSAAGVLGAIETLSEAGPGDNPQVAIDADGDAVAVWQRSDGSNARIEARARSAAGVLGPVQTLSGFGQSAQASQVAIDQAGDATFVWQRLDGTLQCDGLPCARVEARARSAAGFLEPLQTLSAGGQPALDPQVAVDQAGDAVAVWDRRDGTTGCGGSGCFVIQGATSPP